MNIVIMSGRIGRIDALKHVGSHVKLRFSIATERYSARTKKTEAVWHWLEAWDKRAEALAANAVVGQRIEIRGENYNQTVGEGDKKRTFHSVIVHDFEFGEKPREKSGATRSAAPAQAAPPAAQPAPATPTAAQAPAAVAQTAPGAVQAAAAPVTLASATPSVEPAPVAEPLASAGFDEFDDDPNPY